MSYGAKSSTERSRDLRARRRERHWPRVYIVHPPEEYSVFLARTDLVDNDVIQ